VCECVKNITYSLRGCVSVKVSVRVSREYVRANAFCVVLFKTWLISTPTHSSHTHTRTHRSSSSSSRRDNDRGKSSSSSSKSSSNARLEAQRQSGAKRAAAKYVCERVCMC
jgi:hypothetical protein